MRELLKKWKKKRTMLWERLDKMEKIDPNILCQSEQYIMGLRVGEMKGLTQCCRDMKKIIKEEQVEFSDD